MNIDVTNLIFMPAAYLSIFLLPFQYLSRLDLATSFWVWTVINWLVLIGYILFFTSTFLRNTERKLEKVLIAIVLIFTFPVFFNFAWGQVNVLLTVSIGEFIRHAHKEHKLVSGLWLGMLLLKFPLLMLVVPVLLFLRNYRILVGLFLSGSFLFLLSTLLVGVEGNGKMFQYLIGTMEVSSSSNPNVMMNWRMLGLLLQGFFQPAVGWIVVVVGTLITLFFVWLLIRPRPEIGSSHWILVMQGVIAATCVISWHSHIHMSMVLLPFLIYYVVKYQTISSMIDVWIIAPPFLLALTMLIYKIRIPDVEYLPIAELGTTLGLLYLVINFFFCLFIYRDTLKISTLTKIAKSEEIPLSVK